MFNLPKKLLIGLITVFIFTAVSIPVSAQTVSPQPSVTGTQASATPEPTPDLTIQATDAKDLPAEWFIDPEVTAIGKNASRSGLLLDWALQNYDWSYVAPGSSNPLIPFWATLRNTSYAMLFIAIMAGSIIMIVTRGRSVTVRRFIPRFLLVVILVTLSFSLVQFIFQIIDVFQGFFIRPNGIAISQKDLLYIGWNYQPFVGLRALGPENYESAFISLLLVKLTAFTYYVMVGILLVRKIILWFFIIVSPFFPLLLFFYPLRNTAKIWLGEFFRWLLYAPLFAVFLAGLVSLWRAGIPLLFRFSNVGDVIFPTAVSILLGGPGQVIGVGNSVNLADTFGLYVVALLMLWMVIIFPFVLLQIFLDYLSNVNLSNSAFGKSIYNMRNRYPPIAPTGGPTAPPPVTGFGRNLPFLKNFTMPNTTKTTGDQKQIPTGVARPASTAFTARYIDSTQKEQIEQKLAMSIPTMHDIAVYDTARISTQSEKQQEIERIKESLKNISNPANILTSVEKEKYSKLQNDLRTEQEAGNILAARVLNAANVTRSYDNVINNNRNNISNVFNNLANPSNIASNTERERIEKLRELIIEKDKSGDSVASSVQKYVNSIKERSIESNVYSLLRALASRESIPDKKITDSVSAIRTSIAKDKETNEFARSVHTLVERLSRQDSLVQTLMSAAEPSKVGTSESRNKFIQINQTIKKEVNLNNNFARFLTENINKLSKATSLEDQSKILLDIRSELRSQADKNNNLAIYISQNIPDLVNYVKPDISGIIPELEKQQKSGNNLAVNIVNTSSSLSDHQKKQELDKLQRIIHNGKLNDNPVATSIVDAAGTKTPEVKADVPEQNRIQQVSLDDYEAVKKMWTDSYRELGQEEYVTDISDQKNRIEDDMNMISQTIDLLNSNDKEKIDLGMQNVSDILPFLLMGGFSQSEIVSYLKAKQEAGKLVVEEINKKIQDESTTVYVDRNRAHSSLPSELAQSMEVNIKTNVTTDDFVSELNSSLPQPAQTSVDLLKTANITVPTIDKIVNYDASYKYKKDDQRSQVNKISSILRFIDNPKIADNQNDREYYSNLRKTLLEQSNKGNALARNVINAGSVQSKLFDKESFEKTVKLQKVINNLAEIDRLDDKSKEGYSKLLENIKNQKQNGNILSDEILSTFSTTPTKFTDAYGVLLKLSDPSNAENQLIDPINVFIDSINIDSSKKILEEVRLLSSLVNFLKKDESDLSQNEITAKNNILAQLTSYETKSQFAKELRLKIDSVESYQGVIFNLYDELVSYRVQGDPLAINLKDLTGGIPEKFVSVSGIETDKKQGLKEILGSFWSKDDKLTKSFDDLTNNLTQYQARGSKSSSDVLDSINNRNALVLNNLKEVLVGIGNPDFVKDDLERQQYANLKIQIDRLASSDETKKLILSSISTLNNSKLDDASRNEILSIVLNQINRLSAQGNQLAISINKLFLDQLDISRRHELLINVIYKLRKPQDISDSEESKLYTDLLLEIKSSVETSQFSKELYELINSNTRLDSSVVDRFYLKLMEKKQTGDKIAVGILELIQKEQDNDRVFACMSFLSKLSQIDQLSDKQQKEIYSSLRSELEDAARNDNVLAVSLLASSDTIKQNGNDIVEAKKSLENLDHSNDELKSRVNKLIEEEGVVRQRQIILRSILEEIYDQDNLSNENQKLVVSKINNLISSENNMIAGQISSIVTQLKSATVVSTRVNKMTYDLLINIQNTKDTQISSYILSVIEDRYNYKKAGVLMGVFRKLLNPGSDQNYLRINQELKSKSVSMEFARDLLSIANTLSNQGSVSGENMQDILQVIYSKLLEESRKGNSLASQILGEIDSQEDHNLDVIDNELSKLSQDKDPIAQKISTIINNESLSPLPQKNLVQNINIEDYETVRHMWEDNFTNMEVPQPVDMPEVTRSEFVNNEVNFAEETLSYLTSSESDKINLGLERVSNILPFLLIGGFSLVEIQGYLKAKIQAGKTVLNNLDKGNKQQFVDRATHNSDKQITKEAKQE